MVSALDSGSGFESWPGHSVVFLGFLGQDT